jgi:putative ABC transport system ATP-binding protein
VDVVEIQGLLKSFRDPRGGRHVVVDTPNFALREGEALALRGPSGSGKTTFLQLVAGILVPDAGTVSIDGTETTALSEAARDRLRAAKIGYVFQTFNLLQGWTALENVELGMAFGRGIDQPRARSLLDRVGLSDRLQFRPRELSVGQQQRVAIARAVANRPRLVVADEPTGNLDPARAQEAISLLLDVCEEVGAALLLVSHDPAILARMPAVQELSDVNRAAPTADAAPTQEVPS